MDLRSVPMDLRSVPPALPVRRVPSVRTYRCIGWRCDLQPGHFTMGPILPSELGWPDYAGATFGGMVWARGAASGAERAQRKSGAVFAQSRRAT